MGAGKTYKDCYNRSKLLKLKNGTIAEAKEISSNLLSKEGGEHESLKDRLVKHALNTLLKHLSQTGPKEVRITQVKAMCQYLKDI